MKKEEFITSLMTVLVVFFVYFQIWFFTSSDADKLFFKNNYELTYKICDNGDIKTIYFKNKPTFDLINGAKFGIVDDTKFPNTIVACEIIEFKKLR